MGELNKKFKLLSQDLPITKCQNKDFTLDRVMPKFRISTTRPTGKEKGLYKKQQWWEGRYGFESVAGNIGKQLVVLSEK